MLIALNGLLLLVAICVGEEFRLFCGLFGDDEVDWFCWLDGDNFVVDESSDVDGG